MAISQYGNEIDYSKIQVVPMKVYRGRNPFYLWRYKIVDSKTGKLLYDADGHGFTSINKAYKYYVYAMRDPSKDDYYAEIDEWLDGHKELLTEIDKDLQLAEENKINLKVDEEYVAYLFDNLKIETEFELKDVALRLKRLRKMEAEV